MKPANSILGNPLWDLCGFAIGLGLAWALDWQTRDLVWGLWLSSLVIGYASIVLGIVGGVRRSAGSEPPTDWGGGFLGGLFLFAFFTVHFGGFHFGHSVFLNAFFPIMSETKEMLGPGVAGYFAVLTNYWPWLFAAAIAERGALVNAWSGRVNRGPEDSVRDKTEEGSFNPMDAYKNVIRMHLLIFFFAGTSMAGIENFWIYAVVYAVYFFPWSFVRDWFTSRNEAAG